MRIFNKESETPLIDHINRLRGSSQHWHALLFHFSSLQPERKKDKQMLGVTNIVQAEAGQYNGGAYVCIDCDVIVIIENPSPSAIETMVTDLRFLFADDPLASASFVSGQQDDFYTVYDLTLSFDPFFYMCLNKLAAAKPTYENKQAAGIEVLPPIAIFNRMVQERDERKQLKILVVEDSYFSRQMIKQALTPLKHEILLAKDGWEGLAQYINHAPNITFLDIDMPQMNGHDVLNKITTFDKNPFVVMLTASNMSKDIKNAVTHGAKGYIVKPFSVGKLSAYIDQYCKEHGRPLMTKASL